MSRPSKRALVVLLFAIGLVLSWSLSAWGRPGGGDSFSGSRTSHSGGGSGGDGGDAAGLLIQLVVLSFQHPVLGVPLLIIVIGFLIAKKVLTSSRQGWSTTSPEAVRAVQQVERAHIEQVSRMELDRIRGLDPGFSLVLFEDFAYLLYAAVQRARGTGTAPLAAYLAPQMVQALVDPELSDVVGIVIGAMRYLRFSGVESSMIEIELELESNFVEVLKGGGTRRYYCVDRILLARSPSARSRPFARAGTLDCPNCGAPLESVRGTQCAYCRQNVGFGRYDWMLTSLRNRTREPRGPLLTGSVAETGTELPSIIDPGAHPRFGELQRKDPALSWEGVTGRVALIFAELQVAWSGRDALRIRPYVSDNLFQSMYYWIDLYTQEKCRNVNENAGIIRIDLANVMSDAYYDAVTLRVFATGLDYTLSDSGKLLSGSKSRPRTYSEYWTLIRGSARKGPARSDPNCPHCGAPLKIGMAGSCEYCRVKVTSGEFDWVLSRIEQDEAYGG